MKKVSEFLSKLFIKLDFILTIGISLILIVFLIISNFVDYLPFETTIRISLAAIVTFFVLDSLVQHYNTIPLIENINRLQQVEEFEIIDDYEEYYFGLINSIEHAKDSVKLIYVTEFPPSRYGMCSIGYWEKITELIKKKKNVVIQRIASIDNTQKKEWICKNTEKTIKNSRYSLKCFVPYNKLKLLGMEIIDQKDVFLFGPHGGRKGIHIRNSEMGIIMSSYFDSVWDELGDKAFVKKHGELKPDIEERINLIMKDSKK